MSKWLKRWPLLLPLLVAFGALAVAVFLLWAFALQKCFTARLRSNTC
jgi:hypothetical protein